MSAAGTPTDATTVFRVCHNGKRRKHANGSAELGRHYLTIAVTTLGAVGPSDTLEWIDGLFAPSFAKALYSSTPTSPIHHDRHLLFQQLHSLVTSWTAQMMTYHLGHAAADDDPPPPTTASSVSLQPPDDNPSPPPTP